MSEDRPRNRDDAIRPVVDIIIPTNRVSRFLPETLASVRAQTWPDWSLTIVDDGSPNPGALEAMIEGLPRTTVVHQRAAGTSAARNRGLRMTEAPLVVFLDDDDLWQPQRLERQVHAFLQAPQYVGVFSGGSYVDADGRSFGTAWPARPTPSRAFLSGEVPLPRIVTMMVRRDVCLAVEGFDESIGTGQDLDFTLRVLQQGEMLAVPEPLTLYRRHDTNVSQAGSLAGRRAIEGLLVKQVREAEGRHDVSAALLLRENLRRARAAAAMEAAHGARDALRRRDLMEVAAELAWASRTPRLSVGAFWRKGAARLPRTSSGKAQAQARPDAAVRS